MNTLFVALGGAAGAAGRYLLDLCAMGLLGADFPWGTFIINQCVKPPWDPQDNMGVV